MKYLNFKLILLFLSVFIVNNFITNCSPVNYNNSESAVIYYVDSEDGNDENEGLSPQSPWESLSKIEKASLNPGDIIKFKRGSKFTGSLLITDSGSEEKYITLTDYGDQNLPAPSFTNPIFNIERDEYGNCIRITGDYIIVENIYCHHTAAGLTGELGFLNMWQLGAIHISSTAEHCIVRNNEIYDCGAGIKSNGQHTLITHNYIHDCNRVLKEWTWGPIGIWLGADYQEVSYNRIFNYSVVDSRIIWGGGADGGAIEIDDARFAKSNISIHHNYSRNNQGFLEVTWEDVEEYPDYSNFEIHHNISDDYQQFILLWQGNNCKIDNNTIIRRKVNANEFGVFTITENNSQNLIRNNIIIVENNVVVFNPGDAAYDRPNNIVKNNLYFAATDSLNFGLGGAGESPVFGDPMLVNYSEGDEPSDFSITGNSAAIDQGLNLNYEYDFDGVNIPQGNKPDLGAFEFKED